jgi:hypothetical protein
VIIDELGIGSFVKLDETCLNFEQIIVVEDHFPHTGMYSYVTQWASSRNLLIKIKSVSPLGYSLNNGFDLKDFIN